MLVAQQYDGSLGHLGRLDEQMQSVLQQNIPDDLKLKQYNQVLHRFMTSRDQELNRPMTMHVEKDTISNEEIIEALPKNLKNKGKLLMSHLKRNPNISTNDRGEVIYKGNLIEGSNLIDLVNLFVRPPRKNRALPAGWQEFRQFLRESNVPQEAITNVQQLQSPTVSSSSTPDVSIRSSSTQSDRSYSRSPAVAAGTSSSTLTPKRPRIFTASNRGTPRGSRGSPRGLTNRGNIRPQRNRKEPERFASSWIGW